MLQKVLPFALFALVGCGATPTPSSSAQHETLSLPGVGSFRVAIHEDGTVRVPAWMERIGRQTDQIGDARVERLAATSVGMMMHQFHRNPDLRATISFRDSVVTRGETIEYKFRFQQPNRFAIVPDPKIDEGATMISDGSRLVTYLPIPGNEQHSISDAPDSLAELQGRIEWMITPAMGLDLVVLLPLLASKDGLLGHEFGHEFLSQFTLVRDVGVVRIKGRPFRRIQFLSAQSPDEAFEYWIGTHPSWLKRVYLRTDPEGELEQGVDGRQPRAAPGRDVTMLQFDWSNDPLPDTAFAFDPPAGSVLKESLFDHVFDLPENEMVGAQAPDLNLPRLEGELTALRQLLDQHDVLVLDFWATWCAPCLISLPKLAAVVASFADEHVGFYTIAHREGEDKVRPVIERRQFNFPILLDTDGLVSERYGVTGLPHTVVIDRHGTIRHVHIGAASESRIRSEIEALLAEQ